MRRRKPIFHGFTNHDDDLCWFGFTLSSLVAVDHGESMVKHSSSMADPEVLGHRIDVQPEKGHVACTLVEFVWHCSKVFRVHCDWTPAKIIIDHC